jgi:hypothetical protein
MNTKTRPLLSFRNSSKANIQQHSSSLTCSSLPTATATNLPSGLNAAAVTGPLKLKWCSSTRRVRATSSARPCSSMDSSSWPSGLRQSVRTCVTQEGTCQLAGCGSEQRHLLVPNAKR